MTQKLTIFKEKLQPQPTQPTNQPETTNQLEEQLTEKTTNSKNQQPNQPNQPTENLTQKLTIFKEKLQPQPTQPTNPKQQTDWKDN